MTSFQRASVLLTLLSSVLTFELARADIAFIPMGYRVELYAFGHETYWAGGGCWVELEESWDPAAPGYEFYTREVLCTTTETEATAHNGYFPVDFGVRLRAASYPEPGEIGKSEARVYLAAAFMALDPIPGDQTLGTCHGWLVGNDAHPGPSGSWAMVGLENGAWWAEFRSREGETISETQDFGAPPVWMDPGEIAVFMIDAGALSYVQEGNFCTIDEISFNVPVVGLENVIADWWSGPCDVSLEAHVLNELPPVVICSDDDTLGVAAAPGESYEVDASCPGTSGSARVDYDAGDGGFTVTADVATSTPGEEIGTADVSLVARRGFVVSGTGPLEVAFDLQAHGSQGGTQVLVRLIQVGGGEVTRSELVTDPGDSYDERLTLYGFVRDDRTYQIEVAATLSATDDADNHLIVENFSFSSSILDIVEAAQDKLMLASLPPHPNPFRARTALRYEVLNTGPMQLMIFDVAGRLVRTLVDAEVQHVGEHRVIWDGRDDRGGEVSAGVYYYRLESGTVSATNQVIRMP